MDRPKTPPAVEQHFVFTRPLYTYIIQLIFIHSLDSLLLYVSMFYDFTLYTSVLIFTTVSHSHFSKINNSCCMVRLSKRY